MTGENDRRIDYIELPTSDVEAVKGFYTGVFGWTFTDYGPDYSSFDDGRLTGGFELRPGGGSPGGPLIVIYAADLAALETAVRQHGGTVTRPTFEFPGGRRFHFRDPGGNELAVWSE